MPFGGAEMGEKRWATGEYYMLSGGCGAEERLIYGMEINNVIKTLPVKGSSSEDVEPRAETTEQQMREPLSDAVAERWTTEMQSIALPCQCLVRLIYVVSRLADRSGMRESHRNSTFSLSVT